MTREEFENMGLFYVKGVVLHKTKHRGWLPIKKRTQNVKDNHYYFFKHEGKTIAIREETIKEAFKE